jgi:hypothetical protein
MTRFLTSVFFASCAVSFAAPVSPQKDAPPPPYVIRVLALGHEPERKFKSITGGLFVMLPPEPDEIPPSRIYFRPPAPPAALPPGSAIARQFEPISCELSLNAIQEVRVPAEVSRDAKLTVEKEIPAPAPVDGKGKAGVAYEELGAIERKADATSGLAILYNPAGSKTWRNVRANFIDTSESTLPVGTVLVYNLCRENLIASIGSPGAGTLTAGQSAFVRPKTDANGNFLLRLFLDRNGDQVQLVDSERGFPIGSRGFLIVYPVPENRNARAADFILFVIPPDPKPEPVVAPAPPANGVKAAAR